MRILIAAGAAVGTVTVGSLLARYYPIGGFEMMVDYPIIKMGLTAAIVFIAIYIIVGGNPKNTESPTTATEAPSERTDSPDSRSGDDP